MFVYYKSHYSVNYKKPITRLIPLLFVFLEVVFSSLSAQPAFEKLPYLMFNNNTQGMRLLWQNSSSVKCKITLQNSESLHQRFFNSDEINSSHQHILNVDSLPFNKLFTYKINCGEETQTGSFRSRPDTNLSSFTFFAYGDTRTFPENHNLVASRIMNLVKNDKSNQTFVVSTGDMVANGDSEQDWKEQFFDPKYSGIQQLLANMPYMSALGNHEGQGKLFDKYFPYDYNDVGEFFYSFDYGIAHFIVLDQFTDFSETSIQYKWLINDLNKSKARWNIVMMHKPAWTAGGHKNDKASQKILQPIFLKYNIKLVLTGHNHYYARALVDGVTHITTGGGGAPLYFPKMKNHIVTIDRSFHFCKIIVSEDSLNVLAIRSDGTIIESFSIKH